MPCVSVVFGSSTHPWLECPSTTKKMDGPWTEEMILAAVAAKGKAAALALHFGLAQNNTGSAAANAIGYWVAAGCTGTTRYGLVVRGGNGGGRG